MGVGFGGGRGRVDEQGVAGGEGEEGVGGEVAG